METSAQRDFWIESSHSAPKPREVSDRKKFLETDVSRLDAKDLARYLVALSQEVNSAMKENRENLAKLSLKVEPLMARFDSLVSEWWASDRTKAIMEKFKTASVQLRNAMTSEVPMEYRPLQHELTESQVDEAIGKMDDILKNDASVITIGVSKYRQAGGWDLPGTLNDAKAVESKLADYESPRRTMLLDEAATKRAILDAIRNAPKDKPVFLYFAGHGLQGSLMPYLPEPLRGGDGKLDMSKLVSPQELFEAIGDRRAMLVVDKCYGGDLTISAPENVTVVSASDSVTRAQEIKVSWDGAGVSRNEGERGDWNVPGTGTPRGAATLWMTDGWHRWLNLRGFVRNANSHDQNPTIRT